MSRTDAHMPHWVTVTWYEPDHSYRCPNSTAGAWRRRGDLLPCDLPDRPVRHPPFLFHRRPGRQPQPGETRCTWEPDWLGVSRWPRPPRWYIEHRWHNPERVRVRDVLRVAAAEHRATGGTDLEPEPRQARHCAAWDWS